MLNRNWTVILGALLCASLMFVASPPTSQSFYEPEGLCAAVAWAATRATRYADRINLYRPVNCYAPSGFDDGRTWCSVSDIFEGRPMRPTIASFPFSLCIPLGIAR